mmetsp:Transcript_28433/g.50796  ORF Transcript_28433/g.50796 Transcript_28433/m.50796 type:complete len:235 (-) Transcript_28433:709-1413(-)
MRTSASSSTTTAVSRRRSASLMPFTTTPLPSLSSRWPISPTSTSPPSASPSLATSRWRSLTRWLSTRSCCPRSLTLTCSRPSSSALTSPSSLTACGPSRQPTPSPSSWTRWARARTLLRVACPWRTSTRATPTPTSPTQRSWLISCMRMTRPCSAPPATAMATATWCWAASFSCLPLTRLLSLQPMHRLASPSLRTVSRVWPAPCPLAELWTVWPRSWASSSLRSPPAGSSSAT